ncbi:ABC transporter ATP-binding protein [Bullifex porci]|uniref:ABC transporter ATP-binding protein n=1 Tax=Bullifex porci TaxID=2606638 RepID=UPI0023F49EF2|nr:ABC transporter ATP-binding protein [Bullifex porci]MDD7587786.1 ABC transporter ATP-binding protein [Bullifex porci]
MKLFKRFMAYYIPFLKLFILDIAVAAFSSVLSILFPLLTRYLLNEPIPNRDYNMMIIIFAIMLAVYIIQAVSNYIRIRWGHILGVRMENKMRADLFAHLQTLSFSYYDKTKTGTIMSRISNDLFQIAEVAHHGPEDLLISVATIIGAYILMFMISVPLALVSMIPLPFMLFYGIVFGHRLKEKNRAVRRSVANINVDAENSIQGIREVKSFAQEDFQKSKFEKSNVVLKETREAMYKQMASYHAGIGFMRDAYYLITVAGGAILIALGFAEVTDLLTFVLYVSVVLPPIDRLINFTEQLQQGIASFERFTEVMDIKPEIEDNKDAKPLEVKSATIKFSDVSFSYESRSGEKVTSHLDLTIPGGSRVALVGESGAGKTTIVSLLARFYERDKGSITIDGVDIKDVTQESLHKAIGFVQQSVFLFDASIRENLRYGKSDATDEELWQALKVANLYEFVQSLPEGLDTEVGERGTRLSGGQKQRLSIARVFLKNPPILIFDEATSSLDTESEALIQDAFNNISKGKTSIVIAHRLSTIADCDKIFVIEKGSVKEAGTHQELLAKNGAYARLYNVKRDVL